MIESWLMQAQCLLPSRHPKLKQSTRSLQQLRWKCRLTRRRRAKLKPSCLNHRACSCISSIIFQSAFSLLTHTDTSINSCKRNVSFWAFTEINKEAPLEARDHHCQCCLILPPHTTVKVWISPPPSFNLPPVYDLQNSPFSTPFPLSIWGGCLGCRDERNVSESIMIVIVLGSPWELPRTRGVSWLADRLSITATKPTCLGGTEISCSKICTDMDCTGLGY